MNTSTARVDIERLQILNDRLCQTLDALNQVRLSAHNHSYGQPQVFGQNASSANLLTVSLCHQPWIGL
jgi:hypothetical protein